ncbi:unnamed protein product, partial [Iphiclides podalirius]
MNDPWDVKSVRQSSQYLSCMKLNGVPLLPPVLSKECRKEMQYYKLLAKEVEKRISHLKLNYSEGDSDASEDKTDAPELPESEQNDVIPAEALNSDCNEQIIVSDVEKSLNRSVTDSPKLSSLSSNNSDKMTSNYTPITDTALNESSKIVIDLSLSFNPTESTLHENKPILKETPSVEIPVHDDDVPDKFPTHKKETKEDIIAKKGKEEKKDRKPVFRINNKNAVLDQFLNYVNHDGPSSLSSKSFTGSLHDLHKESETSTRTNPLIRQRSYTVLTPSPMLLAHLKIQSLNTGVDITSISMSESLSNISSPNKKRRSWDLETAKVKWSNMALELKKKNIPVNVAIAGNGDNKIHSTKKRTVSRPDMSKSLPRSRSAVTDKPRQGSVANKTMAKSEPIQKNKPSCSPPGISNNQAMPQQQPVAKDHQKAEVPSARPQLISESDDPAKRVRELYERIQKQQLLQMATLVEKQKKEQLLLQQVFEEQNNLLYTQLKTICPKAPGEVKEAWTDKVETAERGPVSLSQLINHKPSDSIVQHSPVSCTLTDTNNYINRCDSVLKKSRDITGGMKKQQVKNSSENSTSMSVARSNGDAARARPLSPGSRNTSTSRKLTYETSASTERECEPILTDRTNDTMADLNVTFPSDNSDDYRPPTKQTPSVMSHLCGTEVTSAHVNSAPTKEVACRSSESTVKSGQDTLKNSILDVRARLVRKDFSRAPTAQERAAATKVVAYARGYLVRRLMRTERVQGTVQTIRDALLCALQLHQDREGIRGADVDLHRRLIQQITAACYSLHDTFITSSTAERCALIAADRSRRRSLALRPSPRQYRPTDVMSHSHTGSFPTRARRSSPTSAMTQSSHESYSGEKLGLRPRYVGSPRRRPWR